MTDLFGKALLDYYRNTKKSPLLLHNKFSDPDELDLEGYLFDESNFSDLEFYALELCKGAVLDVGAAAGRHCIYLQQKGFDVTGLDVSPFCCELMTARGVKKTVNENIFDHRHTPYDTLLMLMNGIGLAANLEGLRLFFDRAKEMVKKKGQIIFDSSDVGYLKKQYKLPEKKYFGEIDYHYEYDGMNGNWFTWLYVDPNMLQKVASEHGWHTQIIFQDDDGQFLARLINF